MEFVIKSAQFVHPIKMTAPNGLRNRSITTYIAEAPGQIEVAELNGVQCLRFPSRAPGCVHVVPMSSVAGFEVEVLDTRKEEPAPVGNASSDPLAKPHNAPAKRKRGRPRKAPENDLQAAE